MEFNARTRSDRLTLQVLFTELGLRRVPPIPDHLFDEKNNVILPNLRAFLNDSLMRQLINSVKPELGLGELNEQVSDMVKAIARHPEGEWVMARFGVKIDRVNHALEEVQSAIEKNRNKIPNHVYTKLKAALKSW